MKSWSSKEAVRNYKVITIFSCIFFGGCSSVTPFLSVHMRSLGLSTMRDAAFVHIASGLACCVLPIFISSLAQKKFIFSRMFRRKQKEKRPKIGNRSLVFKWCLCVCLIITAAFYASMLTVPREVWIPRQPLMDFDCGASFVDVAALRVEKCANWNTCRDVSFSWPKGTRFKISHCRQRCTSTSTTPSNTSHFSLLHPLHVCFKKSDVNSRSKTSKGSKHLCRVHDSRLPKAPVLEFDGELAQWRYTEFRNVSVTEFLSLDPRSPLYTVDVCAFTPSNTLWINEEAFEAVSCRPSPPDPSCSLQCLLSVTPGKQKHVLGHSKVEACYETVGEHEKTFWLYLGLRAMADAMTISIVCLLDEQLLDSSVSNYGRRLAWPAMVMSIMPPAVGALIDYCGEWTLTKPNFSPAFLISSGLFLIAFTIALLIPSPKRLLTDHYSQYSLSQDTEESNEKKLFWWSWDEMLFVVFVALMLGSFWGFSQAFSSWLYQEELEFNHWMLGLGETFCFGCSLPLLLISTQLMRNIGDAQIVSTAFAFHGLRLLGLSFLTTEGAKWWWPLPFEAMRAMTLPLGWVGLCRRSARALCDDSKDPLVVLHCLLNILHFGAGRLLGVCAGGFLSEISGFGYVLRVFGSFALVLAAVSVALQRLYFRSRQRHRVSVTQRQQIERVLSEGSRVDLRLIQWSAVNGGNTLQNMTAAEPERDIEEENNEDENRSHKSNKK